MKKHFQYLVFIAFLFNTINCFAQYPYIQWQKSLGGSDNEVAYSIQQTADGGYVSAGYSKSNDYNVSGNHGNEDFWIVKTDNIGNITWQKSLGGSGNEQANSIWQTTDGGYIVAGYSGSNDGDVTGNHGGADYWIVKLDNNGNILWQKSLGGSLGDVARCIMQTTDGGYIVGGYSYSNDGDVTGHHGTSTFSDYWIVKLTSSGNISWQKSFGGSYFDFGNSIQQTSDGGYIVAGYSSSIDGDVTGNHGSMDYWVVKITSSGIISWQKSLGSMLTDIAQSVQQTIDGGYIVAGYSNSNTGDVSGNHGHEDYWIVKLTSTGIISWQKSLGGSSYDYAYSIRQTVDGGYIVAGRSGSFDGDVIGNHGHYWIVKLNSTGNILWQKLLGGAGADIAYSIQQTSSAEYIVAGFSTSNDWDVSGNHGNEDFWIVKLGIGNCTNSITSNDLLTFCSGDSAILIANSGTNYLWNTGATTQNITVNTSGVFTVNVDGCQYGYSVNVFVFPLPSAIISASGPTSFCSGDSVILSTSVGTGFVYGWLKNNSSISGATSSTYTATTTGNYQVIVQVGPGCSTTSTNTIVTVNSKPTAVIIANGPTSFCPGGSVLLSATTGNGYTYLWKKNNITIAGATASTYSVSTGGSYKVIVTNNNGCTKTSNVIVVTVNTPTALVTPQGPTTFCSGFNVVLKANTGTGFSYQWKKGGVNISGATDSIYTANIGGVYKVVVTSQCGASTSPGVTIAINPVPSANITANGPTTFCNGSSVTFNANTGTGLTYQWKKNTVNISGATLPSYIASAAGSYTVIVTNSNACTKLSNAISVTVNNVTATITANGPTTFCAGGSVLLSANSGSNRTYQWLKNNINISGATALSYLATTAGNYKVIVTNTVTGCAKVSNVIQVVINCRLSALSSDVKNIEAFPNPTTGKVNLRFTSSSNDKGELILTEITGKEIIKEQINISEGLNEHNIEMRFSAKGVYLIKLKTSSGQSIIKVIKE